MTPASILSTLLANLLRYVLLIVITAIVGHGWLTKDQAATISAYCGGYVVPAVGLILTVAYGLWLNFSKSSHIASIQSALGLKPTGAVDPATTDQAATLATTIAAAGVSVGAATGKSRSGSILGSAPALLVLAAILAIPMNGCHLSTGYLESEAIAVVKSPAGQVALTKFEADAAKLIPASDRPLIASTLAGVSKYAGDLPAPSTVDDGFSFASNLNLVPASFAKDVPTLEALYAKYEPSFAKGKVTLANVAAVLNPPVTSTSTGEAP